MARAAHRATTDRYRFADRYDAGDLVAAVVARLPGLHDPLVLGLPRGGIVVAARVAERLAAPLDVVVVRKLGSPGNDELAMGALAVWGQHETLIRNDAVVAGRAVSPAEFDAARDRELGVARHRAAQWQQVTPVDDRSVVLADDGFATGATFRAAVGALRAAGGRHVVAALPVAPAQEIAGLRELVDEVVCVQAPQVFRAVAVHYHDFSQVPDAVVDQELRDARRRVQR